MLSKTIKYMGSLQVREAADLPRGGGQKQASKFSGPNLWSEASKQILEMTPPLANLQLAPMAKMERSTKPRPSIHKENYTKYVKDLSISLRVHAFP